MNIVDQNLELILNSSGSSHSSQEGFQGVIIQKYFKWFIFIALACQIKKFRLSKKRLYICMHVLKYSSLTVFLQFQVIPQHSDSRKGLFKKFYGRGKRRDLYSGGGKGPIALWRVL